MHVFIFYIIIYLFILLFLFIYLFFLFFIKILSHQNLIFNKLATIFYLGMYLVFFFSF